MEDTYFYECNFISINMQLKKTTVETQSCCEIM